MERISIKYVKAAGSATAIIKTFLRATEPGAPNENLLKAVREVATDWVLKYDRRGNEAPHDTDN